MSDLKLLRSARALTVQRGPYPTVATGVVRVEGVDLELTSFVRVNEQPADFSIISSSVLHVQASPNDTIVAYSDFSAAGGEPVVRFHLGTRPTLTTTGEELLRQRFLKALLSDQGSDAFQSLGGGLDAYAGSSVRQGALPDVLSRIRLVEEQMIELQRPDEPAESTLREIEVLGSEPIGETGVRVLIEIINEAGQSISAEVSGE